ncbi:MAG: AAA family ATPase [Treponema sp.]|nr:AAA family ATPase [Treponema sp.]MEE3434223.1 AAA family ATPase [Treponema sp.]
MNYEEILRRLQELPPGGLTKKRINGKEYTYYQWTQDKKQRSRSVGPEEAALLKEQIEERKALQKQLSGHPQVFYAIPRSPAFTALADSENQFATDVRIGESLDNFAASTSAYKKRDIFTILNDYIQGDSHDKVFILYGLRRTGKTTMIRQTIYGMSAAQRKKTVFMQINANNSLADVNNDLKKLEKAGYKYVFIDEVTLMEDFIEGAALFSDVYASSGMKIVLSGTDSLGFVFSEDEQLYDRCVLLHTTFIPFREFATVLGINDLDEYIRYGGTMSKSGQNYNKGIFSTKQSADEYVNTAIARNIQHSLKNYQYEDHFRNLYELYEKNELTSAINRIVEDMNHRFTVSVLTQDFKSHDFGLARANLRRDRKNPTNVLDQVDKSALTLNLKKMLEILNKNEQSVQIKDQHKIEIKEYLDLLDLTCDIDLVNMANLNDGQKLTVFSQPGLRYAQAEYLIKSLLLDERFKELSLIERKQIEARMLEEIKGRMLEEIVLLETKKAFAQKQVFKLQFAVGEFDMVVFDEQNASNEIFEIKHSDQISSEQYRHLVDKEKLLQTERRYGTITKRTVLYQGEDAALDNGIEFRNVKEYLLALKTVAA